MSILVLALAALTLLSGLVRLVGMRPQKMTGDAVGLALVAVVPASAMHGWLRGYVPAIILAAVFLWFLWRTTLGSSPKGTDQGSGRGASGYHAVLTLAAAWIAFVLSNRFGGGPDEALGAILQHMIVAVVLALGAAGWLLATFAVAKDDKASVKPTIGLEETLAALTVAMCFFYAI